SELNKPALYASYKIAHLIARESRPFTIGPFGKQCLEIAAEAIDPDNVNKFKSISLSPRTVIRRIEKLSEDLEQQLSLKAKNFIAFSLALDESTDIVDTAQLAIFIRGVDSNLSITEELLNIMPLKHTTTGEDILHSVEEAVANINLSWDKLASVATDDAAVMVGCYTGFVGCLKSKLIAQSKQKIYSIHCIIHQEALCAKSLKYDEVMKIVIKVVNFIRTTGLNHRQFREFLSSLESDYTDIPYFCETRWLSRGKTLERFFRLREEIIIFLEMKDKCISELSQPSLIADLAFLTDITGHLNTLNYSLQGKDKLIVHMFDQIQSFKMKLNLWINQFQSRQLLHFPNLLSVAMHIADKQYDKYINSLQLLHDEFDYRFREIHLLELDLLIFMTPFTVDINIVPADIQLELIDLKCDTALKNRFHTTTDIVQFYSYVSQERFPRIHARAAKIMSIFGSTYSCEQLFSVMKLNKSRLRDI
ncbi:General transcription factor II-I repeat domain-containing protein 2B, partial [Ooceraea biroi]